MEDDRIQSIIETARRQGRSFLYEYEAKSICRHLHIPTTKFHVVKDESEALEKVKNIGYPVAVKVVSKDVLHKSDIGGVILNVTSDLELKDACHKILENVKSRMPYAEIHGLLVEEMICEGVPVIIGMVKDQSFGPTIMFGLGGIFTEVLRDVSFRVAPLMHRDAEDMITEINGYPILQGVRGGKRVSVKALIDILLKISEFSCKYSMIQQIDLNPILATDIQARVVDARIILST